MSQAVAALEVVNFHRPVALLERRRTHFVLWRPGPGEPAPKLVLGRFRAGSPPTLADERTLPLARSRDSDELWELAASACELTEGAIYHYWFEVPDTNPYRPSLGGVRITDPTAYAVDWRLTQTKGDVESPAAVVRVSGGKLVACDPGTPVVPFDGPGANPDAPMKALPPNNRLVIYELPTAWTKAGDLVDAQNVGVGTFRDVQALIEPSTRGGRFAGLARLREHRHLIELGANALELLPPADTFNDRKSWGYATSNYFAPDFDLGQPLSGEPTPIADLIALVRSCHAHGIRFFYDAVMAFSNHDPYRNASFLDFHVHFTDFTKPPPYDHLDPEQDGRDGFGGDLWKYAFSQRAYDPISGDTLDVYRARQHMIAHLLYWMSQFHVDGLRLDSVNNYDNWDFAADIRREARASWKARWRAEGNGEEGADERFLVVGEELSVPKGLLSRLDGLWNEEFKRILRKVVLGRNADGEPSFEWSVRKLIDCRNLGFSDGTQAVNYVGSHDVGGEGNERLYNYLHRRGVALKDKPIKLAFACLLTAVGIPMILAGDEFADEHDVDIFGGNAGGRTPDDNKQLDPVNYERLEQDPWRKDVFQYVSRLVAFRTQADALCVNDTAFIHVDFNDGKRVLVWRRGNSEQAPVLVVANFSDWGSDDPTSAASEYRVPSWPDLPRGKSWREVTQARAAPRAGREPLFPWEAKVYTWD
jgi:1,4-alpha-glucan branching enzyme